MTFDLEALQKIEKYVGLIVNKYTGKGQTFCQFIKDFGIGNVQPPHLALHRSKRKRKSTNHKSQRNENRNFSGTTLSSL